MIATSTGVYGNNEQQFFDKILKEKIEVFIDVRQRRGMRGNKYKFVNSNYLQNKLSNLNIKYIYIKDLAPTSSIREIQKKQDSINEELKSSRKVLNSEFIQEYNKLILEKFNFENEFKTFENKKVMFFCVEENYCACHRSLILNYLSEHYKISCYHF